ncbi:hypothetical protein [Rhodanobacter sp. FW106-PBR-LB-2-19]|uniref:Valyl-tRNA synthetase tRNA-binding arm domain-containing protein n=1 Tax=Rhodanobacter humi TaxID=1888173 RepID=A0ABV4ATL6_9GAMM
MFPSPACGGGAGEEGLSSQQEQSAPYLFLDIACGDIEGKLGNANFVANAPAEVVAQERQRIVDWNTQLAAMREQAGKLGG